MAIPRTAKQILAMALDLGLCVLSVWLAYYFRLGEFIVLSGSALFAVVVSIGIALPLLALSGAYREIFRHSGGAAILAVARALVVYGFPYALIFTGIGVEGVPRTLGVLQPILLLLLICASRLFVHLWLGPHFLSPAKRASLPNALIYGAGLSGRQLASAMMNSHEMRISGFLDDDEQLQGHLLNGKPIYSPAELLNLVSSLNISLVLLAMPSLARGRRNEVLSAIRKARVSVRTLPNVSDLAQGKVLVSDLRELDIDDLLGREPVVPDHELLAKTISSKIVLVTGAGGSIGSELCRQILAVYPKKLLLLDHSEFALYRIHQELQERLARTKAVTQVELIPLIASVQDEHRMREIMSTWRPKTVFHAAAYKHVPIVEHNVLEGIKNNVFGTLRTAKFAAENEVSDFVLVSTDKAVRPTNIMGASKRLAEMILQAISDRNSVTTFSMVRFGNVLGSSGSVVPKFRQQIRDGGPITLTHPDVTRYFMTVTEASQLVIQAAALAEGGDVFVLDMGQPVKISDLARRIIELSGLTVRDPLNPGGDIPIEITGLRPGEKLYEELLIGEDPERTDHPRILKAHEAFVEWGELEKRLSGLDQAVSSNDVVAIRSIMKSLVLGFVPSDEIVDWVFRERELAGRGRYRA